MGVPVRHQRKRAGSAVHARETPVSRFRIVCASSSATRSQRTPNRAGTRPEPPLPEEEDEEEEEEELELVVPPPPRPRQPKEVRPASNAGPDDADAVAERSIPYSDVTVP